MTLETFFEKFELFADAPDAVEKMRELVLELAVRGKLSERKAADKSDLAWQAFINAFDSRIYGSDPGPQPPFEIPEEWRWVIVADAADCRAAAKVDSASLKDSDWVLDLEDIDGGTGKVMATATFAERRSLSTKASFQEGDVLYGKLRPYLNKVVIADRPGFCTTEIIPLRPQPFVAARYFRFFLRSQTFLRYATQKNYGMKMPRLGTKDLESAQVPLPPLAEQKRIVAKVDELMALCDRLEAQQQERETRHAALARASLARFAETPTPANLDFLFHQSYAISSADLRKSILTLAVQGKLVPQDPNDEPAEVFLKKIADSLGVQRIESDIADSTKPFDLPQGWAWSRFRELGEFGRGKSKHRPRNDLALFAGGHHRLVQTGDVARANGVIETFTSLYNDVGLAQSRKWPAGTLCITIAANIADSGILGFGACFPDSVVGFIPADPIPSVRYFEYFMRTAKERLEEFAPSTAQKNINLGILEQVLIPIPPLAEQRRIVAKVDELMALVDALENQLATARTTAVNLLAAVVAELTSAPAAPKLEAKSNIIQLSTRPEFIRSLLAAEIIDRSREHESFGQTKFQKIIVLTEYLLELPEIDSRPRRFARGPHDPDLIRQVEGKMEELEWFQRRSRDTGKGWRYVPLARAGGHRELFEKQWPVKAAEIRRLIDLMRNWDTERCERFATVYSAWNDLLLEKRAATDAAILREVLEKWHPDKNKIEKSKWQDTLAWMRRENLIPRGFGQMTRPAETGELFSH